MDSDLKTVDDDEDSTTKHVLDYYKKYSLNKELPKYFSGTSVSYLPEIKADENPEVVVKTDINIVISEENKEVVTEEALDTSRASSVTSNRKLEWDNGADIGYDNCLDIKLIRKSSSLPVLSESKQKEMSLKGVKSNMGNSESQSSSSSSSDNVVKLVLVTDSSSSEPPSDEMDDVCVCSSPPVQPEEKESTSSSSNVERNVVSKNICNSSSSDTSSKQRITQFASKLSDLKKKIGLPDAHSTPKCSEGIKNDPVLQAGCIQSKNGDPPDKHVKFRSNKVINLSLTAPVAVECVCHTQREQEPNDPPVEILKRCTTVGVQTDSITEQELIQMVHSKHRNDNNQSLLFFEYSESDGTFARSTQTNSIIASNCDSFEFFKNSPKAKNDPPASNVCCKTDSKDGDHKLLMERIGQIESTRRTQNHAGTLRRSQRTEDLRTVPRDEFSQQSSGDYCLGNIVSMSQLNNLGNDIEKSINLLQKLLKSKKYDPVTKKRYVKKIVKKISESKYLEESSASSDFFFPKKSKEHSSVLPCKVLKLIDSDSSDEHANVKACEVKLQESSTDSKVLKNTLQSNLPWGPASCQKAKSPRKKKLGFKTFTQDFLPKPSLSSLDECSSPPEIIPTDSRDTRKNCFTLTNNEFCVEHKSDEANIKSPCGVDNTSLEQQCASTSTSKSSSYKNWREDKTLSEKLFEQQSTENGDGDCLVQFAERERKYQIKWINNEICHLGKLKGLLEKPVLEPCKSSHKTTVYTVSEESDAANKVGKKSKHKFVIETQLDGHSSKDMCYQIGNKKYTVHNSDSKKSASSKNRLELGVVDVVSSDSTTNIKVSSFCEMCKRAPCICGVKKPSICQICKSDPCTCHASKKMGTNGFKKSNTCWKCKRTCNTSSMESTLSGKTICLDCHKAYCTCMKTRESVKFDLTEPSAQERYYCYNTEKPTFNPTPCDEYAGTFIPFQNPKSRPKSPVNCNFAKYSTFPYTAKDKGGKKIIIKCSNKCSDCGGGPCDCLHKDYTAILPKNDSSGHNEGDILCGSLKKVFENCPCTSESNCDCGFVQKLIKYFDICDIPTSILKDFDCYDKNEVKETCQSEENKPLCACQSVGVQVEMDSNHLQEVHRPCGVQSKILQTDGCPTTYSCENLCVQTDVQTRNQTCQKSAVRFAQHISAQCHQPPQIVYQCQETSTALIKYNGGDKNDKKPVSSAEKGTNYCNTKIEHVKDPEKKNVACSSTQVDSNMLQTSTGRKIEHTNKENAACGTTQVDSEMQTSTGRKIEHANKENAACGTTQVDSEMQTSTGRKIEHTNKENAACGTTQVDSEMQTSPGTKIEHTNKENVACGTTQMDSNMCQTCTSRVTSCSKYPKEANAKKTSKGVGQQTIICANKGEQCKSDSLESNTRYEVGQSSSETVSSCNNADSSESISEESSVKIPALICICCKKEHTPQNVIMQGMGSQNYPLCRCCIQRRPILTAHCYAGPHHVCNCYQPAGTGILHDIKRTVNELYNMERCSCVRSEAIKNQLSHCNYCQFKLSQSKKGIAYTLTLENENAKKVKGKRKKKKPPLEEIRMKVPSSYNRKKTKDKENSCRKDGAKEKVQGCSDGVVNNNSPKQNKTKTTNKTRQSRNLTLQEYLKENRPKFIDSAEYRRQSLLASRSDRELHKEELKLRFLDENINNNKLKKKKLFTEREMKEITKQHYKKLPEIKQRVNNAKQKKLRFADKVITEVFTRKVHDSVLQGKRNFPLDRNLVNLSKKSC